MTHPMLPSLLLHRSTLVVAAARLLQSASLENARAATIGTGDVTATPDPAFFGDDAVVGGTDTTQAASVAFIRSFAGLLNSNPGPTPVTLTGNSSDPCHRTCGRQPLAMTI